MLRKYHSLIQTVHRRDLGHSPWKCIVLILLPMQVCKYIEIYISDRCISQTVTPTYSSLLLFYSKQYIDHADSSGIKIRTVTNNSVQETVWSLTTAALSGQTLDNNSV